MRSLSKRAIAATWLSEKLTGSRLPGGIRCCGGGVAGCTGGRSTAGRALGWSGAGGGGGGTTAMEDLLIARGGGGGLTGCYADSGQ